MTKTSSRTAVIPGTADSGSAPRIIDTHHHIFPPGYASRHIGRLLEITSVVPASDYLNWSARRALDLMDQAGVATAINSITSPGVWFENGEAARSEARECNEFGAGLARDFPGRFGMFGAVPLPDAEGSLREIEHVLDMLKLDGIVVLTNYAGKLLGDPAFAAVFDELNRRKAVVFVHPTMPCCVTPIPGVGAPILDFPVDTTRTMASLVFGGTFSRCPDIRFIFPHGGGVMPSVVQRIASVVQRLKPEERAVKVPRGLEYELRRQYYDLAGVGFSPAAMAGVLQLYPISQLLFGSDEPFNSTTQMAAAVNNFGLAAGDLRAIQCGNGLRLFPRFGA